MKPCDTCNFRLKLGMRCWYIGHLELVLRVFIFAFGCERYRPWWKCTSRKKP